MDSKVELDIARAIGAASRGMTAAMMARVAAYGYDDMTPAFASLMPLLETAGARPSALAERAGITKQAMSQLTRELEERGYVEQVADPTDTRAKLVRLTKRGVALRNACAKVRVELEAIAAGTLGRARLTQLRRDLLKIGAALSEAVPSRK